MKSRRQRERRAAAKAEFTDELKEQFLDMFRYDEESAGSVALCCENLGLRVAQVNRAIETDAEFAEAFADTKAAYRDGEIRLPAFRRAFEGQTEKKYWKGEVVEERTVASDALAAVFLKSEHPSFAPIPVGGPGGSRGVGEGGTRGGVLVVPTAPLSLGEWSDRYKHLCSQKTTNLVKPSERRAAAKKDK